MDKDNYIKLTDAVTKQILSHNEVLAYILKVVLEDCYDGFELDDIVKSSLIDDQLNDLNVRNVEIINNEKKIILDMCIEAKLPNGQKAIFDIEIQKKFHKIEIHLRRANSYVDGIQMSDYKTIKGKEKYSHLKPTFSIWLFIDPPKKLQGTVTDFYQVGKVRYGKKWINKKICKSLRLKNIVFIFLAEKEIEDKEGMNVLSALFNENMKYEIRKEILKRNNLSNFIREEVDEMMDVGKTTWENGEKFGFNKGEKSGIKKGEKRELIKNIQALMEKNYTLEEALSLLNVNKKIAKIVRKKLNK